MHRLFLPLTLLLGSCTLPPPSAAPVRVAVSTENSVTVPMFLRADAPHVRGRLNAAAPLPVLIDTGASISVLESSVATACELHPAAGRPLRIRGVHGNTTAYPATLRSLDLGGWLTRDVTCYIRNSTNTRPGGLGSIIVGVDHLRRHCSHVTFDFTRGSIAFGTRGGPSVPKSGRSVTRTPLRIVDGLPVIHVTAGGIGWDAVVDTGSSWGIVIDQAIATRLGHARDGRGLGRNMVLSGVGGSIAADDAGARVIHVPAVSLGGRTLSNPELFVMPGPNRIGSRFWRGGCMTLDFTTNTLWLQH